MPTVTAIYLYESSGIFKQDQLVTSVTARVNSRISFNGSYTFGKANSDTDAAGTFPANSDNLHSEYGPRGIRCSPSRSVQRLIRAPLEHSSQSHARCNLDPAF